MHISTFHNISIPNSGKILISSTFQSKQPAAPYKTVKYTVFPLSIADPRDLMTKWQYTISMGILKQRNLKETALYGLMQV